MFQTAFYIKANKDSGTLCFKVGQSETMLRRFKSCHDKISIAGNAAHLRNSMQGAHDFVELVEIFGFDEKLEFDKALGAGLFLRRGFHRFDVGIGFGNGAGNGGLKAVGIM